MLLNSVCVLYKSATEEVSIWGWPLQAAGLLHAEYSSRSFTITSGSVAEVTPFSQFVQIFCYELLVVHERYFVVLVV